ncbi:conserved oligomeric Golgi complex subunit 8-like [Biomphalaria glabrata]|uniref:Conserved oligomeric Golgi complex subunit 8 n=1 Tax=Biomphalaria glabrata TaxID=6526 RepID=A0A9W2YVU8_BIOGL|nr:conserved oligomeric Golgi complex subunit 8-like [Biomphalaria glabrata]
MAGIDVEDENILTSIFKDSFSESWQENPDFVEYLVELSSYGAERLSREPDRLSEEKAHILAETQDLAFHNYTTFIQTADCSKEIFQDFQIIEQHLESLLNKLPNFSEECKNVIQKAQEISSSRRMNILTLQRHSQLLEILEMPQLMDTCVRNRYYEEALELAAYARRLEKKHPNIHVIIGIVNEVKASTQLMLNQLIQQLRTNLQLPACLKVIGYLRRLDVFTEAELRIQFLQARDSWFQTILDSIPKGDPYNHINKTIEASRVHLFDIMTQFRAIFSDEDPLVSTGKEDTIHESLLFHSWVLQKILQFLETLEKDLEEGIGGRLDSILGQCMYFGLSFSRVGADFRGLLAPIFEKASLRYFVEALKEANKKFEENMQSYNLLGLAMTGGITLGMSASQSGHLYPPTTLLDFYPLAAYCNHLLTAFNDLRLCAPMNLACKVADELQKSFLEVNRVILAFHRAEETTLNSKEKDQFEQFCATYATDLLPFINKCMHALFPPAQLANSLGWTLSDINKKGNIGIVDLAVVLSNITHLMPVQPELTISDHKDQPVTFTLDFDPDTNSTAAEETSTPEVVAPVGETKPPATADQNLESATLLDPEGGASVSVHHDNLPNSESNNLSLSGPVDSPNINQEISSTGNTELPVDVSIPHQIQVPQHQFNVLDDAVFDLDHLDNTNLENVDSQIDLDKIPDL